ncbi:trigger factor [Butyrivibrio sp. VCB2006]|uniref:trigger factor n=1 Tax=Butyrivibrio sp. VCB2006 TaxID=1280679 RepID=UPI000422FD37|nr:trigger factor [Butyrivibrio sp. VCB2006]
MKKKLSVLLAGVMVCTMFTACGKEAAEGNESAATDSSVEAAATENSAEAASGLTIDFDNLETKVLGDVKASDYVTLGEYNGITLEAKQEAVTDAAVEDYVNNLWSSNPLMLEITDRTVQDGDTVDIDYVGKYADTKEAFDGGTAEGASLKIGSNTYIDGFESGLVGAEVGETRDLNLTFPEDYGAENLAGKDVIFTVTVNKITAPDSEMSDEWAAGLGLDGVTDLASLKEYAFNTLTEQAKAKYDSTVENTAVQMVYDAAVFGDIPQELVNRYMLQQKQMLDYQATMYSYYYGQQLTTADMLSMYMNNEGFVGTADDYLNDISKDMAQQYILFQAIADEQGIEVSEDEINDYLKNAYDNASTTSFSSFEEYKASLDLEIYREGLMADKVVEFIVNNAHVVQAETTEVGETAEAAGEASSTVAE